MLSFASASAVAFSSMPACPAQFVYAEKLTDLDQDSTKDFYVPPDDCFYPITLPSLEASGHVKFAWLPPSKLNDTIGIAPEGAFVYQMKDNSTLYKKVVAVSPDDSAATLKFEKMQKLVLGGEISFQLVKKDDTHEDPLIVNELQKAIRCTEAPVTTPLQEIDARYKSFVWAAGPFKMAGVDSDCGAYVFEKEGGGLVYHSC